MTVHDECDPILLAEESLEAAAIAKSHEGDAQPKAVSRRHVLKVIAAATGLGVASGCAPQDGSSGGSQAVDDTHRSLSGFDPVPRNNPLAMRTLTDPDLLNPTLPWETVLTEAEMRFVTALCDLIIPADQHSPSASQVGVADYIDEHISAPYAGQKSQLVTIRGGLTWLNQQARQQFGATDFPALTHEQQRTICDPISYEPDAPTHLKAQARFFDLFRDLTSTGFWTTLEGMADLGYVGNIPMPSFEGPPPEVLQALGLSGEDLA